MSRFPSLTPAKMIAALRRGGFVGTHQKGSHVFFEHPITGKHTMVAMHRKDLTRALMKEIISQAGLSEKEFRKLL
ncbi:MAG: type II toxin-antitoxin system HicA family toxin [Patescibacteria group bacterium]